MAFVFLNRYLDLSEVCSFECVSWCSSWSAITLWGTFLGSKQQGKTHMYCFVGYRRRKSGYVGQQWFCRYRYTLWGSCSRKTTFTSKCLQSREKKNEWVTTFWKESLQRREISFLLSIFQEEKREEVKEWVLAVSMDQKVGFKDFSLSLAYLYHVIKIRCSDWLHPRVTPLPTPPHPLLLLIIWEKSC